MYKRMTARKIWDLACRLTALLIEKGMWVGTIIYFQGQTFQTEDYGKGDARFHVSDSEGNVHTICIVYGDYPENHFRHYGDILSVSCEVGLEVFTLCDKDYLALSDWIAKEYGLFFELGDHWNMSLYHI